VACSACRGSIIFPRVKPIGGPAWIPRFPSSSRCSSCSGSASAAGAIADRKGYNFVLFAVIGLFLGIIGLLIALVLPKKKPAYAEL
jgi:hypothetical protein